MSASETQRPLFSRDLPESKAITNVAPKGQKGARYRAWVKIMAALAATALPDCLWAEGRTLLPSRWGSKPIIIIIACDNKKIIIGLRTPLSGRNFWDAPSGGSTGSAGSLGGGLADRREAALPQGFLRRVGQGDFWDAPRGAARAAQEALGED